MLLRRRIHPAGETNVATHRCAVDIFLDKMEEKPRQSFDVNSHVVRFGVLFFLRRFGVRSRFQIAESSTRSFKQSKRTHAWFFLV
jgi:hypothetical protein